MLEPKHYAALLRADKRWMKKRPTQKDIVALALAFGKAVRVAWDTNSEKTWGPVRGLDEFDEKRMAAETRVYRADQKRDLAKEMLLRASAAMSGFFVSEEMKK